MYRRYLKLSSIAFCGALSSFAFAAPQVDSNIISWPDDGWYQVQQPASSDWDICNSSSNGTSCEVDPGSYRVINHSTGERFDVEVGGASSSMPEAYRQTSEMIDFATGDPVRGGAVLTRTQDRVTLTLSALDLSPEYAYSVWWVIFNNPENCLVPMLCSDQDVFEAPGDLNDSQTVAVRISAVYAAGFVTGSAGNVNFSTEIDAGNVPVGTFIDNGWSEPVDFGPDENAGLVAGNGMKAEMHVILRSHGPAVAGYVGNQTTTLNGQCDVQTCSFDRAVIFRPPSL